MKQEKEFIKSVNSFPKFFFILLIIIKLILWSTLYKNFKYKIPY